MQTGIKITCLPERIDYEKQSLQIKYMLVTGMSLVLRLCVVLIGGV